MEDPHKTAQNLPHKTMLFTSVAQGSSPLAQKEDDDIMVFLMPPEIEIPADIKEDAANNQKLMDFLKTVSKETGFPTDLLIRLVEIDGFMSIRTSELPIPRGSFRIQTPGGDVVVLGDPKDTTVGSKSQTEGVGLGKIAVPPFNDPDKADLKDNDSLSIWPNRENFIDLAKENPTEHGRLKEFMPELQEARIYDGLIYCTIAVPEYKRKATTVDSAVVKQPKHYCQEAETLKSIFDKLRDDVYREAKITNDGYLEFKDKKDNYCRICLATLIPPLEFRNDEAYLENVKKIASIKNISELEIFLTAKSEINLAACHAPLFTSKTPANKESFVPVVTQTGRRGEAIIRDADFEHFYTHPLIPPLALKSFNGADTGTTPEDLLCGLRLLKLRLESPDIQSFKTAIKDFIEEHQIEKITITNPMVLKELGINASSNSIIFEGLDEDKQMMYLLAKYNDLTTLDPRTPYLDYTDSSNQSKLRFGNYLSAVDRAIDFYEQHPDEFKYVGESGPHDLVFIRQINHPMVMHSDEAVHPKGAPEKFARITAYCNKRFFVTNTEEQYLKLLFSNPQLLQYIPGDEHPNLIREHPNWLRNANTDTAKAWDDLLTIQALRHGVVIAEIMPGVDPIAGYDMFIKATIFNLARRYVKGTDQPSIEQIQDRLTQHFTQIRNQLMKIDNNDLKKDKMHDIIEGIYATSKYNVGGNYSAYSRTRGFGFREGLI